MAFFKGLRNNFNNIYVSGVKAIYKPIYLTSYRFHWSKKDQVLPATYSGCTTIVHDGLLYMATGTSGYPLKAWNGDVWVDRGSLPEMYNDAGTISGGGRGALASFRDNLWFFKGNKKYRRDFNSARGWVESSVANPYRFKNTLVVWYNDKVHAFGGTNADSHNQNHYTWTSDMEGWVKSTNIPVNFYYSGHPMAMVYNGKIHMIGRNYSRTGVLQHYTWDDENWVQEGEISIVDTYDYSLNAIFEDNDGNLCIATSSRIFQYNDSTNKWRLMETNYIGTYSRDSVINYKGKIYRVLSNYMYDSATAYKLRYGE